MDTVRTPRSRSETGAGRARTKNISIARHPGRIIAVHGKIMFDTMPKKKKFLDVRYNEVWNDFYGTDDHRKSRQHADGDLTLSWKNLTVSAKQTMPRFFGSPKTSYKKILHNVSGNVISGCLLGIMGPSGSGKTTLMSTISHRTKGNFEGELLLNGKIISEETMIKISGYVPQNDVSFDQLTALENLILMANLTMDRHTSSAELEEHVDRVIRALGMDGFSRTRISLLSGGERKKVALAVQLLGDPPILFCDEITTGLDGYTAAHIVNTLRSVARTGKMVVCTIHQPASGVFGKFDEVVLLTGGGRLAYHGPVSLVGQFFQRFGYVCPDMFSEADFVISILNSDRETDKNKVHKMCELSSSESRMLNINYDLFNREKQVFIDERQTQKPAWTTHFRLIFDRSFKCFLRSYRTKMLDLGVILFLGISTSAPYSKIKFDTNAVQNWGGFWFLLITDLVYHISLSTMSIFNVTFSVVHREVQNNVYPLSAYYVSELLISTFWIMVQTLIYCVSAFWMVGVEANCKLLSLFFITAMTSFSYACLVESYFDRIENALVFTSVYNFFLYGLSGAYLSLASLPKVLYHLRYLSIGFLSCETVSIEFWDGVKNLPCIDVTNCLDSGQAVLRKYGYIRSGFFTDVLIMATFCVVSFTYSYIKVLNKMKRQPAY